ncbi:tol-pal system protein YbgF [Aquisalinus flavus]|uniref:tol-pal system protein YbgF n=1 Tax=Aquisalinus flavus TaxID=1526572 RepID=UPI00165EC261|nr:tol-pal system protein YbgF [Aquisalinus flavus]MBD0426382.1 tol-pal system protein YbgF [Aquisalinus flavus]
MPLTMPSIGSNTRHFRHALKKACVLTVLAFSGIGLSTAVSGTASAQQQGVTPERLSRIERAISDLQGVVYSAEGVRFDPSSVTGQSGLPQGPDSSAASMTVRVSQIERELQTLTGDVERLRYEIDQNNRRIESLTQALSVMGQQQAETGSQGGYGDGPYDDGSGLLYEDDSSAQYGGGATGGPSDLRGRAPVRPADGGNGGTMNNGQNSGRNTGVETGLPPGVDSPFPVINDAEDRLMDPDAAYEGAFDALLSGNYQEAEEGFSQFLADYPDDPRAADAQYRLGEIYLATGANSRAAVAFLDHIKKWPDDARAPESYLKLGISYNRLGKNAEACQIYSVMGSKYPNMTPALRDRMAIERGKAGC